MRTSWTLLLGVALLACQAQAAETVVTFSGKTTETIVALSPLTFTSLETKAYTDGAEWTEVTSNLFMATTNTISATETYLTPNTNVQNGAAWKVTFTTSEAMTLTSIGLQVIIHNSGGNTQYASAERKAVFSAIVNDGGDSPTTSESTTQALWGAASAAAQDNWVEIKFANAVTLAADETLSIVCTRSEDDTQGCYFALSQISLNPEELRNVVSGTDSSSTAVDGPFVLTYDETVTFQATVKLSDVTTSATLLAVEGGSNDTSGNRKGYYITVADGTLSVQVAGKNGTQVTITSSSVVVDRTYTVILAIANSSGAGTSVTARAGITGQTSASSTGGFNFNNDANSTYGWVANAPYNVWTLGTGLSSLTVTSGTAMSADDIASVIAVSGTEIATDVEWTADLDGETLIFAGGTLTIPSGTTVNALAISEDSTSGSVVVNGTLEGVDTGEPGVTAFAFPTSVSVELNDGSGFFMDGRLTAPLTISGTVSIGAGTENGTLKIDNLTLADDANPTVTQGCVEVYEGVPLFAYNTGTLLWRWALRVGYLLRLR